MQSDISLSFSPSILPSTAHPGLIPTDGIHNASLTLDIEFFTLFFKPQIPGINHIQCLPLFLRINSQSIFIMCLCFVLRSAYYWVMDRAWLKLGIFTKRSLSQTLSVLFDSSLTFIYPCFETVSLLCLRWEDAEDILPLLSSKKDRQQAWATMPNSWVVCLRNLTCGAKRTQVGGLLSEKSSRAAELCYSQGLDEPGGWQAQVL